eukprot:5928130-Pyramimonas_sp.AAC.1
MVAAMAVNGVLSWKTRDQREQKENIPVAGTDRGREERIYPYRAPIAEGKREYTRSGQGLPDLRVVLARPEGRAVGESGDLDTGEGSLGIGEGSLGCCVHPCSVLMLRIIEGCSYCDISEAALNLNRGSVLDPITPQGVINP